MQAIADIRVSKASWSRGWEAIVDADSYPVLAALLRSEAGGEARAELERLLGHFWQERAERRRHRVQAKLFIPSGAGDPIPVETLDISSSGALLSVPYGNEIDVMTAAGVHILLRADTDAGPRMLRFPATLVRMAGLDDAGVRLGFRFDDPSDEHMRFVDRLVDVD